MSGDDCSARLALWTEAHVPYAVAGGNAIAAWVSRVDEAAVRNTQDAPIRFCAARIFPRPAKLWSKPDLFIVTSRALTYFSTGRMRRRVTPFTLFLPPKKSARIMQRPCRMFPNPEATETFRLLSLNALVRMKLTSFRDKDRVHLRDLMDVGLVDAGWLEKVPPTLRSRLQELLDNPEG